MEYVVAVILFDKDRSAKPQTDRTGNANRSERFVRKVKQ